jgi:hypothetical protein
MDDGVRVVAAAPCVVAWLASRVVEVAGADVCEAVVSLLPDRERYRRRQWQRGRARWQQRSRGPRQWQTAVVEGAGVEV